MLTLDIKTTTHSSAAALVRTHFNNGQVAFRYFVNCLSDEASIYRLNKKNEADIFRQEAAAASSDTAADYQIRLLSVLAAF